MNTDLYIYNSLSAKKEKFEPLTPSHVGMYVCGPTVYGDAHLGHARPAITFDLVFRYLKFLGYKVRYVRNITDVGHLEHDADAGEDKIAKKARLEQLEPMEVAQYYTNSYHHDMMCLNILEPSIEPHASGHIIEQIDMVQKIIDAGYAYVSNGSVYFDVPKYNQEHNYGILSGRKLEDMLSNTRELDGQQEKRNPADFALWKKASPEHIMRWQSPWSVGFPGWHAECSAMGAKYLGMPFDIHGGGMDLKFPHHESEIAQAVAAFGISPVKYWMHNNMITINGQKMGKSLGNFITLDAFFSGNHPLLEQAYSPMTIRFFILQAHYRSELDFSNEALIASEKGLKRLLAAMRTIDRLKTSDTSDFDVAAFENNCFAALNDDLNTPILMAHLFDAVRFINSVADGKMKISPKDAAALKKIMENIVLNILGIKDEETSGENSTVIEELMNLILDLRTVSRQNKDWTTSDKIRDALKNAGVVVKDGKDGTTWEI
ncbi:MAG: cysteine--tRNA ligase [Bacteroidales bacterium]|jgi:cysteinyl-tRNA synthetase|nr:cysteine--tRNA ligase [Bacteroidales bacterium]MDD3914081.1 cysteine--tRNA ligase [Bacteroidales bacterium]MDD4634017.1 cysteine--tRNA ligase [Bacteroidales bacterium]